MAGPRLGPSFPVSESSLYHCMVNPFVSEFYLKSKLHHFRNVRHLLVYENQNVQLVETPSDGVPVQIGTPDLLMPSP